MVLDHLAIGDLVREVTIDGVVTYRRQDGSPCSESDWDSALNAMYAEARRCDRGFAAARRSSAVLQRRYARRAREIRRAAMSKAMFAYGDGLDLANELDLASADQGYQEFVERDLTIAEPDAPFSDMAIASRPTHPLPLSDVDELGGPVHSSTSPGAYADAFPAKVAVPA
ncbi:hypothetical protein [Euzebya pacifica]|uniref:hypothetical protein n=1 Tax=Euzebya pacifica TaxID=1608957 RepID=UPI0030F64035